MDAFEINEALETFQVFYDTREQSTPQLKARLEAIGNTERHTLRFGDYCGCVWIGGKPVLDTSAAITARCVIERKMSLDELAMCFTRGRDRFQREFDRAAEAQAKVYLLVEGGSYEAILNHRYRSKFHPEAFMASLTAWSVRYNMTPVFCKASTSGRLIREILYRDTKERLCRGEYG